MQLELDDQERILVSELVEARIRELHPTIRRSRVYECTEALKQDLEKLEQLWERLRASAVDVEMS